ncbi:hypothetical protein BC829DRAFT_287472 [Chytridium lagenaria]|nr:hypothetical protein BC829DRAFT_287472 [Chytridium lagenaria]
MALLWNTDVDEVQVIHYHENSPHSQLDSVMFGVERQSSVVAASRLPVGIRETVQEKNHTILHGDVCVRWSTAKWCIGFISWRSARLSSSPPCASCSSSRLKATHVIHNPTRKTLVSRWRFGRLCLMRLRHGMRSLWWRRRSMGCFIRFRWGQRL